MSERIEGGCGSKYWDLFEVRIKETISAIGRGGLPPLRRLSLHITNKCNLKCSYCNETHSPKSLDRGLFQKLVRDYDYMGGGVLHITGGEPSCIPWLFLEIELLGEECKRVDFHLNTNLITEIPVTTMKHIKRLKVSLDTWRPVYFDSLVGVPGAWNKVVSNLMLVDRLPEEQRPITSITYTMTRENFYDIPGFLRMYYDLMPNMYAVFFSVYKGDNKRFAFSSLDIETMFDKIKPEIDGIFAHNDDKESKFLFEASHSKKTFVDAIRFEENRTTPCFLQLSELVVNEDGDVANCSHLYRDGTSHTGMNIADNTLKEIFKKSKLCWDQELLSDKCLYGCNQKLVTFNQEVMQGI